ncbi:hypothetical protein BASA83_000020 [Batrachochytrium salamandrivorans]|nr:hypothetical protein BASA83_000020 [Batrachochytrium salamandrivorans]
MGKPKQPQRKFVVKEKVKQELPIESAYTELLTVQTALLTSNAAQTAAYGICSIMSGISHREATLPQQALLGVVHHAFADIFADPQFATHLRSIKDLFLERDFTAIFTNPSYLPVYAAEYIPCRALCYRDLFLRIEELRTGLLQGGQILCLGAGNGSEALAIGSALHGMQTASPLRVHIQDRSSYGSVLSRLAESMQSQLGIGSPGFHISESTGDLLEMADLTAFVLPLVSDSKLITAMFLLNELLATSKRGFTVLMSQLIQHMSTGSYFLVVDSAGSFSEVALGTDQQAVTHNQRQQLQKRTYMAYEFLDPIQAFRICASYDSIWFRCDSNLSFPLKLNNMRYFLRLYQKL